MILTLVCYDFICFFFASVFLFSVFLASAYAGVFLEPVLSLTFLVWSRSSEVEKGEKGVCKKKSRIPSYMPSGPVCP